MVVPLLYTATSEPTTHVPEPPLLSYHTNVSTEHKDCHEGRNKCYTDQYAERPIRTQSFLDETEDVRDVYVKRNAGQSVYDQDGKEAERDHYHPRIEHTVDVYVKPIALFLIIECMYLSGINRHSLPPYVCGWKCTLGQFARNLRIHYIARLCTNVYLKRVNPHSKLHG